MNGSQPETNLVGGAPASGEAHCRCSQSPPRCSALKETEVLLHSTRRPLERVLCGPIGRQGQFPLGELSCDEIGDFGRRLL